MNSGKLFAVLLLVIGVLFCGPVLAKKGLSYNYAEIGYVLLDSDFDKADGVGVNVSMGFHDIAFVGLSFSSTKYDELLGFNNASADQTSFGFSIGARHSLTEAIDVVADVLFNSYQLTDIHLPPPNITSTKENYDTYGVDVGLRAMLSKKVELNGFVGYFDTEGDTNVAGRVGMVVKLTKKFSAVVSAEFGDEDDAQAYFVGVRLNM